MDKIVLNVEHRLIGTKGYLNSLRKNGKIPAILYGKNIKSTPVFVYLKEFNSVFKENDDNTILNLNLSAKENKQVIVRDIQKDVITQKIIHIDFQVISLDDKIEMMVPIHIEGIAKGVKDFGGVMEFIIREIKVKSLLKYIPKRININVSSLKIGEGIKVIDLPKIENVEYIHDKSSLIVHVINVIKEDVKNEEQENSAMQQPEIINKGKKDKNNEKTSEEKK
ncbi:MAG: 50S ribosomal protein L25 [Endomicrobium sp.]|jgi:large subunit ribosomal protein L25|nr:50S ribosomal protein L25 [Endomicrobium sp.]